MTSEGGERESEVGAVAVQPARSVPFRACHDRDAGGEFAHREAKIRALGIRLHRASLQRHYKVIVN